MKSYEDVINNKINLFNYFLFCKVFSHEESINELLDYLNVKYSTIKTVYSIDQLHYLIVETEKESLIVVIDYNMNDTIPFMLKSKYLMYKYATTYSNNVFKETVKVVILSSLKFNNSEASYKSCNFVPTYYFFAKCSNSNNKLKKLFNFMDTLKDDNVEGFQQTKKFIKYYLNTKEGRNEMRNQYKEVVNYAYNRGALDTYVNLIRLLKKIWC